MRVRAAYVASSNGSVLNCTAGRQGGGGLDRVCLVVAHTDARNLVVLTIQDSSPLGQLLMSR